MINTDIRRPIAAKVKCKSSAPKDIRVSRDGNIGHTQLAWETRDCTGEPYLIYSDSILPLVGFIGRGNQRVYVEKQNTESRTVEELNFGAFAVPYRR